MTNPWLDSLDVENFSDISVDNPWTSHLTRFWFVQDSNLAEGIPPPVKTLIKWEMPEQKSKTTSKVIRWCIFNILQSSSISFFLKNPVGFEKTYTNHDHYGAVQVESTSTTWSQASREEAVQAAWTDSNGIPPRQFLDGDDDDSPEDVEYTHEITWIYSKFSWIFMDERHKSWLSRVLLHPMFDHSSDGLQVAGWVTLRQTLHCDKHSMTFHLTEITRHDILLHCTGYSIYVMYVM